MGRSASRVSLVVLVALAACGDGSDGDSADDGPGPLAELMGWEPEEPAESRRKELEIQELVAECMRAEGWEYQPVDYAAQFPDAGEEDVALMDDPEAFGDKYGYGMVRNHELYEEEGLLSGDDERGMGVEFEDPNQDYVESLSQSEMEEYYATLQGDPEIWEVPEDEGTFVSPPLEEQGCDGQARLAVYGESPLDAEPEIQERMNDYWESSRDDPRMEAAAADWVECMDDTIAGLEVNFEPVDHPDDMWAYMDQLKMEAMGLEAEPFDDDDPNAWNEDIYTVTGGDVDGPSVAFVGDPEPIPEAELEELRSRELEVWAVDDECKQDVDFAEIQRQLEQELVDEIRADFPELIEADSGS